MKQMKTPLIVLTLTYALSFLDSTLSLGIPNWLLALDGLGMLIAIGWLWVVYYNNE